MKNNLFCVPLGIVLGNGKKRMMWFSMSVVLLDDWANDGSVDNLFTHGMILVI